jgi:hypothetical protein
MWKRRHFISSEYKKKQKKVSDDESAVSFFLVFRRLRFEEAVRVRWKWNEKQNENRRRKKIENLGRVLWFFEIFLPKYLAKNIGSFWLKTSLIMQKCDRNIVFLEKRQVFFAENYWKLQKNVIVTPTPWSGANVMIIKMLLWFVNWAF